MQKQEPLAQLKSILTQSAYGLPCGREAWRARIRLNAKQRSQARNPLLGGGTRYCAAQTWLISRTSRGSRYAGGQRSWSFMAHSLNPVVPRTLAHRSSSACSRAWGVRSATARGQPQAAFWLSCSSKLREATSRSADHSIFPDRNRQGRLYRRRATTVSHCGRRGRFVQGLVDVGGPRGSIRLGAIMLQCRWRGHRTWLEWLFVNVFARHYRRSHEVRHRSWKRSLGDQPCREHSSALRQCRFKRPLRYLCHRLSRSIRKRG